MPSKKKKYNSRFPPARIKKIMQSDEDVGKVAQVVPIIISKALEIFVASLLRSSSDVTRTRNARTLTPSHIKASILSDNQFHFLRDLAQSIPDVQTSCEDEEDINTGNTTPNASSVTAPRLQRKSSQNKTSSTTTTTSSSTTGRTRGRPRKRPIESQSQQTPISLIKSNTEEHEQEDDDEDDDEEEMELELEEEDEDDDEEEDEEDEEHSKQ